MVCRFLYIRQTCGCDVCFGFGCGYGRGFLHVYVRLKQRSQSWWCTVRNLPCCYTMAMIDDKGLSNCCVLHTRGLMLQPGLPFLLTYRIHTHNCCRLFSFRAAAPIYSTVEMTTPRARCLPVCRHQRCTACPSPIQKTEMDLQVASASVVMCDDRATSFGAPDVIQTTADQLSVQYLQDQRYALDLGTRSVLYGNRTQHVLVASCG